MTPLRVGFAEITSEAQTDNQVMMRNSGVAFEPGCIYRRGRLRDMVVM